MDAKLIMTADQIKNRNNWLEQRKAGIGGSDAAAIVNMSPWSNAYKLWGEKIGEIQPKDISDQKRVYLGTLKEDTVATAFEHYANKKVKRCGMYQSNEYPWMLATPDRLVVGENAGLECKTTEVWNADYWEGDNIPDAYFVQVLHYMATCGFDRMYIACMIGNSDFIWKVIERNDVLEDITNLVEAEKRFWSNYVVPKIAPPVDASKSCTAILNNKYKSDGLSQNVMQMDSQMDSLCRSYKELTESGKAIEKQVDLISNQIRELMQDCVVAEGVGFKATYKYQNNRPVFNKEAFLAAHPEITDFDTFYTRGESRVLRISKVKTKKI